MRRTVVAIDLSAVDEKLLTYLKAHRERLGIGPIAFVHVLPEKFHIYPDDKIWSPLNPKAMEDILDNIKKSVGRFFDPKDKNTEFQLCKGDPLSELVDYAHSWEADLVVIGQKSGVKKHGILAKNLVRNVKCNGLVVPDDRPDDLSHILVPIDFSRYSAKSLKQALELRGENEAVKITALHVYELPAMGYYKLSMTERKFRDGIRENIEDSLRKFVQSQIGDNTDNIQIKAISRGVPGVSNYLTEYALASNVDFIIMGAKGHSKIKLMLMGSVTEGVLATGNFFPTLIVK